MAIARRFEESDRDGVLKLLKDYDYGHLPNFTDRAFVSAVDGEVIGFIWAIVDGENAYIDYLCVKLEARQANVDYETGRSKAAIDLCNGFLGYLNEIGVKRIFATLADTETTKSTAPFMHKVGAKFYRSKYSMSADLGEMIEKLKGE
jgi:hypothetical protein